MTLRRLVSTAPAAPRRGVADMGDADGTAAAITLTDRYVERAGRPWFPVMGEFHFSRAPRESWETELLKMKSGGIDVVATYVLWILHEERRGELDWQGNRDLREFISLAGRHGLAVLLRIGPWAHGETRNGGFPDWLQSLEVTHRTDDPRYLDLIRPWYQAIAEQVDGLFHSAENPDVPIIGVQVENELYDQPEHLLTLRRMAEELGMRASIWTATGWGGAQLPDRAVLPVYAGYSDAFWEESSVGWPGFGPMHFSFSTVRDDLSVGADLRRAPGEATASSDDRYPYVTCELGGGMHVAYHRRPLVDAVDVAALALTKLGSGSAWQGYYLYHGATQAIGADSTTQESHETGYPNDVPVLDYDFFAPIGALGQTREHYHRLRQQHLFVQQYGHVLATLPPVIADAIDGGIRWAVRGDGDRGYLFVNNHQPASDQLAPVDDVRFEVAFDDKTVRMPARAVTVPSGAHFVWPLRQRLGSMGPLTGTVQPVTEIPYRDGHLVVVAATDGIDVELVLEDTDPSTIIGATTTVEDDGRVTVVPDRAPSPSTTVTVGADTLLILDPVSARSVYKADIDDRPSVLLWAGPLVVDRGRLRLFADSAASALRVVPGLPGTQLPDGVVRQGDDGVFESYVVDAADVVDLHAELQREPGRPVQPCTGGSASRLSAPRDDDYRDAAVYSVTLPETTPDVGDQVLLRIDWVGDVGRARIDGALVSDQFWNGRTWDIDVTGHASGARVDLEVLPWRPDSTVYVDPRVRPAGGEPTLEITGVRAEHIRTVDFG